MDLYDTNYYCYYYSVVCAASRRGLKYLFVTGTAATAVIIVIIIRVEMITVPVGRRYPPHEYYTGCSAHSAGVNVRIPRVGVASISRRVFA